MANQQRPPVTPEMRQQRHESRTSSTYKAFLRDLAAEGKFDMAFAEKAAVSVLCALEQRITGEEAEDLESQLPLKLRELLVRCEKHKGTPPRRFGKDEFFAMVGEDLGKRREEVEAIVRSVFTTVRAHITEGEGEDVASQLPKDLQELWTWAI